MGTIKRITAESGEECMVDVEILHDTLLKLPASLYIELYRLMQLEMGDRELVFADYGSK